MEQFGSQVRSQLPLIQQPVLVIQGRRDFSVHPSVPDRILRQVRSEIKEAYWMENSTHGVIIDNELDQVAGLTPANAQDVLEVLDDRYSQAATIVASQMPVNDWFTQIPNPTMADAILDRLVHNAYRLQLVGESQRKLRAIRSMPHT